VAARAAAVRTFRATCPKGSAAPIARRTVFPASYSIRGQIHDPEFTHAGCLVPSLDGLSGAGLKGISSPRETAAPLTLPTMRVAVPAWPRQRISSPESAPKSDRKWNAA
jgi:hypothetical protein